jgi:hypothetical protein
LRIAPKLRCKGTESLPGIATCKLTTRRKKTKLGYRETVTAAATTRACVARKLVVWFNVETPALAASRY